MSPNRRRTAALAAGAAAAALLLLFHNGGGGGGGHLEYVLTRRNLQYLDSPSRFTEPLPVKESLKKNKIYFVKTHKCASSSVQNILLRHAMAENLTVALSSVGNYLGRHMPFRRSMLAATPWEAAGLSYDIFCLHHIFNKEEAFLLMSPKETAYVTIVRDPVELYISMWNYANFAGLYNMTLEKFLTLHPLRRQELDRKKIPNLGRNQMLYDLGLNSAMAEVAPIVDAKINEVDETFDLVMVAERFDESLVLLRQLMGWSADTVTSLKLNAQTKKAGLSVQARATLAEWLAADYKLYNHFKAKFERTVEDFGSARMSRELEELREANREAAERCHFQATPNSKLEGDFKLYGKNTLGYSVGNASSEACRWYGMAELKLVGAVRSKQAARAIDSLKEQGRLKDVRKFETFLNAKAKPVPVSVKQERRRKLPNTGDAPGIHLPSAMAPSINN